MRRRGSRNSKRLPEKVAREAKRLPIAALVAAVLVRNSIVQPSSRFDVRNPYTTTRPEPIQIRLNAT